MRTRNRQRPYQQFVELETHTDDGLRLGILKLAILLLLTVSAALTFVWLRSKTEVYRRDLGQWRTQYELRVKEVANLHVQLEHYTGRTYLKEMVKRLRLGLAEPDQGQVRRVVLDPPDQAPEPGKQPLLARAPVN